MAGVTSRWFDKPCQNEEYDKVTEILGGPELFRQAEGLVKTWAWLRGGAV